MTEEKKPHVFKPGDRVWFEGKKYTLIESSSTVYPLCLDGMTDRISFNEYGKQLLVSTKPSLKPVKKKKRQEVWVVFDEAHVFVNAFEKKITAEHYARINRGHIVRFVKAKEKRQE